MNLLLAVMVKLFYKTNNTLAPKWQSLFSAGAKMAPVAVE
jgi:hypothetical protein